ncbi:hypothetical protein Salat_0485200 [Sesamum alatum]|uniref:PRLI-interacting factor A n=1 Tax=Sesamum alatum TaxID=300844 RepID=A0AAE1Z4U4_9LAMI|nr:hypothetical protein Salat_0485200 [Sesamum alatum]
MNEQATMMNQQQQQQQQLMNMNQNLMSLNQINQQPQMVPMNRSYGMWSQPQQFQNPSHNPGAKKPPASAFKKSLGPRSNWKGKKVNKPNDKRRTEQQKSVMAGSSTGGIGGINTIGGGGVGNLNFNNYNPPTLNELQNQNRLKTRKFFPKKKFNKNYNMNMNMGGNNSRSAPFAPRNTTSFIIRAKKSGGIAPLVSPYPVTPAVLPTPILSPSREVLVDMAKEEWGVDGYGSMKGLIRLRSPGHEMEAHEDDEEDEGSSSESDVEEHVEVERRLDHDLSRFEMIYDPNNANVGGMEFHNVLENRVDDQDSHIAQLEEENLILKERLFLMERELKDLRRRMLCLERKGNREEGINEEVVENDSENESESRGEEAHSVEDNNEVFTKDNIQEDRYVMGKGNDGHIAEGIEAAPNTKKVGELDTEGEMESKDEGLNAAGKNNNITDVESKEGSDNASYEVIEANRSEENVAGTDENNNDEDGFVDAEVKVFKNDVGVESSEHVMVGEDVCMLEDAVAKDDSVSDNDARN